MDIRDFELAIIGGPTLGEIASSFIRIKTAAKQVAPPDETGALEGKFALPIEKVMALMTDIVKDEFETIYAYHVYANSLRDLTHDAIADHFEEHAGEELDHANFLLQRLSVLGGPVQVPDVQAPPACSDPCEIIKIMIRYEQEAVAKWRALVEAVGDNAMKTTAEDYMTQEQQHVDDLWQLLPHEANRPLLTQKTAETAPGPDEALPPEAMDPYQRQMLGHQMLGKRNLAGLAALTGAIPGAIGGSVAASHFGKAGPLGTALGGVGGALLGAAPGALYALKQQRDYENMNNPEMKMASAKFALALANMQGPSGRIALMRKMAFEGDVNEWLAREQMLGQAQEQAETDYFKGQAQQAQAQAQQKDQELQGLQQQLQQIQQQQQQMQQELDQGGQVQRQILDQARQVEQAAAQSAAAAHQTATASMLQSMQAQQEVMRHKGMTANMQQNVQGWKEQLQQQMEQILQADPTQGAGEQVGMPASGPIQPAPQVDPATGQPLPQEGGAPGQGEAPMQGAPTEAGPAGQAPGAEGNPASPTPVGADQAQAPTEQQTPEQSLSPATKQGSVNWVYYRQLSQRGGATKVAFPFRRQA